MEKLKSFRSGRIWLNVFVDKDGELALTIRKTLPKREGGWRDTPFLRPRYNDIHDLVQVVTQYMEFIHPPEQQKILGWAQ